MNKPRIKQYVGLGWFCFAPETLGAWGGTPEEAYNKWVNPDSLGEWESSRTYRSGDRVKHKDTSYFLPYRTAAWKDDYVVFSTGECPENCDVWIPYSDTISSVNGQTGTVVLDAIDLRWKTVNPDYRKSYYSLIEGYNEEDKSLWQKIKEWLCF